MSACASDLEATSSTSTPFDQSEEKGEAEKLFQAGHDFLLRAKNHAEGVKCYAAAAGLGHAKAQVLHGLCHVFGLNGRRDLAFAQECYDKADKLGEPTAKHFKNGCYRRPNDSFGHTRLSELKEVIDWCMQLAQQESIAAEVCLFIGRLFCEHKKIARGKEWCMEAAEKGRMIEAQCVFGEYLRGSKREEWYFKAVIESKNKEAFWHELNYHRMNRDRAGMMAWCRRCAVDGSTDAQRNYAEMLLEEGNISDAKVWYERASEQGCMYARYEYAELLRREGRRASDRRAALAWYSRAAAQGHKSAGERFEVLSSEPYLESSDAGLAEKFFEYGSKCFQPKAEGNPLNDYEKGVQAYERAAGLGHARACSALAVCLALGIGVKRQDLKKAYEWNEKARERGDVLAGFFKEKNGYHYHDVIPVSHAAWLINFCTNFINHTIPGKQTTEDRLIKNMLEMFLYLAYLFQGKQKTGQAIDVEASKWIDRAKSITPDSALDKVMAAAVGGLHRISMGEIAQARRFFKAMKSDTSDKQKFIICSKDRDFVLKLASELVRDVLTMIHENNASPMPLGEVSLFEKFLDCCEPYKGSRSEQAKRESKRAIKVHKGTGSAVSAAPAKVVVPAKAADNPAVAGAGGAAAGKVKKRIEVAAAPSERERIASLDDEFDSIKKQIEGELVIFQERYRPAILEILGRGFDILITKTFRPTKDNRKEWNRQPKLLAALHHVAELSEVAGGYQGMLERIQGFSEQHKQIRVIHSKAEGADAVARAKALEALKAEFERFKIDTLALLSQGNVGGYKSSEVSAWYESFASSIGDTEELGSKKEEIRRCLLDTVASAPGLAEPLKVLNDMASEMAAHRAREAKAKADRDAAAAFASASASGRSREPAGAAAVAGAVQSDAAVPSSEDRVSVRSGDRKSLSDVHAPGKPLVFGGVVAGTRKQRRMAARAAREAEAKAEEQAKQNALQQREAQAKAESGDFFKGVALESSEAASSRGVGAAARDGGDARSVMSSGRASSALVCRVSLGGAMPGCSSVSLDDRLELQDLKEFVAGLSEPVSEAAAAVEAKRLSEHPAVVNGQVLVGVLSCVGAILERAGRKNMQQATEQLKMGLYQSVVEEGERGVEKSGRVLEESPILSVQALNVLILRWIEFVYEDDPNCDNEGVIQKTFSDWPLFSGLLTKGPKDLSEVKRLKEQSRWDTCRRCIEACHIQLLGCDVELRKSLPWVSRCLIKMRQEWLRLRIGTQLQLLIVGDRKRDPDAANVLRVLKAVEGFEADVYKRVGIYTKHLSTSELGGLVAEKPAAARPPSSKSR